jgi:hypothetical protein
MRTYLRDGTLVATSPVSLVIGSWFQLRHKLKSIGVYGPRMFLCMRNAAYEVGEPMAPSTKISLTVLPVFVGSALTMSLGTLMACGTIIHYPDKAVEGESWYYAVAVAILLIGFGLWGIASGRGLIKAKQWARFSTLIFAATSILLAISGAVQMLLDPRVGALDEGKARSFRPELIVFYGLLAAFGAFYLYFLNTQSIRSKFVGSQLAAEQISKISRGL